MTLELQSELKGSTTPVFDALILITSQGERLDLAPLLVEMAIYEDIFSPVLTGWITITDSLNLFDDLPISGAEKITSKIYSWNYSPEQNDDLNFLHRTFDVTRITDIVHTNDYTKEYTIHFASPELKKNELFKLSKGYTNTTLSKVVSDLLTNDFDAAEPVGLGFPTSNILTGLANNFISPYIYSDSIESRYTKIDDDDSVEMFVEKTKYTEPIVSFPYMKPFEIIQWICDRSVRHAAGREGTKSTNEAANFVFFENKRGFQFTSIDTLLETKEISTTKFLYGNAAQNISKYGSRGVYTERINNLQIHDCYDIIDNIRNGTYSSKLYTYNLQNGQVEQTDYNYNEQFDKSESTERLTNSQDYGILSETNQYLTENYLSKTLMVVDTPNSHVCPITSEKTERINDNAMSGSAEYLQKRMSQLARLSNFRMMMSVSANTKHKVGDMVEIDIKSPHQKNNINDFQEQSNKYYSGFYLITSIKHTITKREYKMNIEVVKDSYKEQIK